MKKFGYLLLSLVVATAVLVSGGQPKPFPPESESAARLQPGPAKVLQYNEIIIDTSRPTPVNGDYAGDSVRRMEGTVWHPATNAHGPYPLIVFSHGFSTTIAAGAYLAEHLASFGYVVVAVNYPLTNWNAPGGPNAKDVVNQPADVSFLIDTLIAQGATQGHVLQDMVDGSRIGVVGTSLGGLTTELVTFHPTMRDPRIGAAISIAGLTAMFSKTFFDHASVPFMMVAGKKDALVSYATNAAPMLDKVAGSQLVTISNGSHIGFSGVASPLRWLDNPDVVACWVIKRNLGEAGAEPWSDLLGSQKQGIDQRSLNIPCKVDPMPNAMNVLRQHMVTSVVVSSFFQSHFAVSAKEREVSRRYLSESMEKELTEVSFRQAR